MQAAVAELPLRDGRSGRGFLDIRGRNVVLGRWISLWPMGLRERSRMGCLWHGSAVCFWGSAVAVPRAGPRRSRDLTGLSLVLRPGPRVWPGTIGRDAPAVGGANLGVS